jgi:hypothetical protein
MDNSTNQKTLNDIMWSDAYLIKIEEDFDKIFEKIYEKEIIDNLFPENDPMISMDFFKEQILHKTEESD